ncbi:M20/M25/M40 family metallo-hydrolase [Ktedonosporobacter rubrisoli]|uniref:M20/M25/M40 family metallo-hydrolase n=1 Tax=Ktedonosporobacter rubrisoli TaxID=2509675 RepID=A0A4P6JS76_KTERU|nr:M20/M25/M40 family metallo-hydrolase [Ktedonosporobacter rubrisoli]QBD78173.1 M20/M25/M40 family metallo-hydrolase [Ktedonosporobacter rubrisoli]
MSSFSNAQPDLSDAFSYIDQHRQQFLERLMAYLRLPSISAYGQGIEEVANYIAQVIKDIGLQAQVLPTEGWPIVLAELTTTPDAPTVLLYGHYDVQPPDPLDAWVSPPFEPTIRNDRLYARGAGDNKGQHFAQLLALETLLACRGKLPCNVKVLLEGEEEIGSPRLLSFVQRYHKELAADLLIVSDGPVYENGRAQIVFGARGILSFELRARGARQDLHSGNWGNIAPNPLWTLVHLLATMKNERGEITIDGFYDNVLPLSNLEREAIAKLPTDVERIKRTLEIQHLDQPLDRDVAERLIAWPTLTINGLHGGYAGPGTKSVLPHEAFAKCDIRLVPAQTADEIFAKVAAHVQRHAPEVMLLRQGSMEPAKTSLASPYTEALHKAVQAAQGEEPLLVPSAGGSLPNYVFTQTLGIPVFEVPYANVDEANHAPNENLEIERFFKGIKTGVAMLTYLSAFSKSL